MSYKLKINTVTYPRFLFFALLLYSVVSTFLWFLSVDYFLNDKDFAIGQETSKETDDTQNSYYEQHLRERGFTNEQIQSMSPLAKWLLAPEESSPPKEINERSYLILAWGKMRLTENIKRNSNERLLTLQQCSTQNCIITYEKNDLDRADAVVFHLPFLRELSYLPERKRADQRWIFMIENSPASVGTNQKLSDYNGVFNWSMSYRMNSDVPIPFGRTVQRLVPANLRYSTTQPFRQLWESELRYSKTKLIAVMINECHTKDRQWHYMKELKQSLGDDLDIIGSCLDGNRTICPGGSFSRDCTALNVYKFYLSFENFNCREYITEKVFWNAYQKYAVPVIMGAPGEDSRRLLPPRSFLSVDNFTDPTSLAGYLKHLDRNDDHYLLYHEWRDYFRVLNEHGYFGSTSKHYCRICEALNYNPTATKVYDDLKSFWSKDKDCTPTVA